MKELLKLALLLIVIFATTSCSDEQFTPQQAQECAYSPLNFENITFPNSPNYRMVNGSRVSASFDTDW